MNEEGSARCPQRAQNPAILPDLRIRLCEDLLPFLSFGGLVHQDIITGHENTESCIEPPPRPFPERPRRLPESGGLPAPAMGDDRKNVRCRRRIKPFCKRCHHERQAGEIDRAYDTDPFCLRDDISAGLLQAMRSARVRSPRWLPRSSLQQKASCRCPVK